MLRLKYPVVDRILGEVPAKVTVFPLAVAVREPTAIKLAAPLYVRFALVPWVIFEPGVVPVHAVEMVRVPLLVNTMSFTVILAMARLFPDKA
jgi:hypothetical protein